MANRYWVGGNGTWDTTSTTNWSAASGGAGGASAPTTADAAIFDANSGAAVVTLGEDVSAFNMVYNAFTGTFAFGVYKITLVGDGNVLLGAATYTATGSKNVELTYAGANARSCFLGVGTLEANAFNIKVMAGTGTINIPTSGARVANLDFTGFSGSWTSNGTQNIAGNLTLSASMTDVAVHILQFAGSTTQTITTNGVTVNRNSWFTDTNTKTLADNFTTLGEFRLIQGTLDATNKNVSAGTFFSSYSTVRALQFGSGAWTVSGASWDCTNGSNLTITYSAGALISMTSASAKTFIGGGKSWPTLNQGGAGALTITGANTFANITNTVQPATITFPASTTTTVSAFGVSGTSGNQITLNSSTAGTRATLSDASGQNSVSFCTIKDINATGGAIWSSFTTNGNVDDGNNIGWDFNDLLFRYIYTRRKNKVIFPL
jgi:hypothetical protein